MQVYRPTHVSLVLPQAVAGLIDASVFLLCLSGGMATELELESDEQPISQVALTPCEGDGHWMFLHATTAADIATASRARGP